MNLPNDLRARYLERRKNDLQNCTRHLSTGNLPALEKVGHQLKGNGDTFGFPELSAIGGALERAARDGVTDDLLSALDKFQRWVTEHPS